MQLRHDLSDNTRMTDLADKIDRTISWAPMMGYSDKHARALFRLISPNCLLFTEMVVASALLMGDKERFLGHAADAPCALQLGGSDPEQLAACAKMGEDAGYQEINLNVGCPSDRVQQGAIGACLMAEPRLVAECIDAMQRATQVPVTVKCRIGVDDLDQYSNFENFIETVSQVGCDIFYVHARKAFLKGLSPKENRDIPPLKYEFVTQIQDQYPNLTFLLNGGITTKEQALELLGVYPGVMIGRSFYKDPWLLAELEAAIYGTEIKTRTQVINEYLEYGRQQGDAPRHLIKHLLSLFNGFPGARLYRRHLSESMIRSEATFDLVYEAMNIAKIPLIAQDVDKNKEARLRANR